MKRWRPKKLLTVGFVIIFAGLAGGLVWHFKTKAVLPDLQTENEVTDQIDVGSGVICVRFAPSVTDQQAETVFRGVGLNNQPTWSTTSTNPTDWNVGSFYPDLLVAIPRSKGPAAYQTLKGDSRVLHVDLEWNQVAQTTEDSHLDVFYQRSLSRPAAKAMVVALGARANTIQFSPPSEWTPLVVPINQEHTYASKLNGSKLVQKAGGCPKGQLL